MQCMPAIITGYMERMKEVHPRIIQRILQKKRIFMPFFLKCICKLNFFQGADIEDFNFKFPSTRSFPSRASARFLPLIYGNAYSHFGKPASRWLCSVFLSEMTYVSLLGCLALFNLRHVSAWMHEANACISIEQLVEYAFRELKLTTLHRS